MSVAMSHWLRPPLDGWFGNQDFRKEFLIQSNQWVTLSIRYDRNATANPPSRLRPRQHLWSDARRAACPTQSTRVQQDLPGEGERRTGRPARTAQAPESYCPRRHGDG